MTDPLLLDFVRLHPDEAARLLGDVDAVREVVAVLPDDAVGALLAGLRADLLVAVLAGVGDELLLDWLQPAGPAAAVLVVGMVGPERRRQLRARTVGRREFAALAMMLAHDDDTVGAAAIPAGLRVFGDEPCAVLGELLQHAEAASGAIHVVDRAGRHRGIVPLGRALRAREARISDIAEPVPTVLAETTIADAVDLAAWVSHGELPVIDGVDGAFVGCITLAGLRSRNHGRVPVSSARVAGELFAGMVRVGGRLIETLAGGGRGR